MEAIKHDKALYRVVLSHYLTAAVFFLTLAVQAFVASNDFSGHYFQPKLLAMVHTAALGWGTMVIFGALYQLLPVILERSLFSIRLCWLSFTLFVPGIALLIYAFWIFSPGIYMQAGALFVLAGILCSCINVLFTVLGSSQRSIYQEYILTSSLWLLFTTVFGVLLVFNFRFPVFGQSHLHLLRLHAHIGIVGWFLMLIIGISAKLIPMFLISKYHQQHLLTYSFYLINAALIFFLLDGYFYGINDRTYVIMCVAFAGIGCYLIYIYHCFRSRLRRIVDPPMGISLSSFVFLFAAVVLIPLIILHHFKDPEMAQRLSVLYGVLIFMGWISSLILGQTFKTLPFIIWVKHYGHLTGKVKTPMPADLVNGLLLKIQAVAFMLFSICFCTGFMIGSMFWQQVGWLSLLLTALAYVLNVSYMLFHRVKTKNYE